MSLTVRVDRRAGTVTWSDGVTIRASRPLLDALTTFARERRLGNRTSITFRGEMATVAHEGPGWTVRADQLLLLLEALAADERPALSSRPALDFDDNPIALLPGADFPLAISDIVRVHTRDLHDAPSITADADTHPPGPCEQCWDAAFTDSRIRGGSQVEHYQRRLKAHDQEHTDA